MSTTTSTSSFIKGLHCVVYRTGGWANFKWHRTTPTTSGAASITRGELTRMGYLAMVVNYNNSLQVGLPQTFEGSHCGTGCGQCTPAGV